MAAQVFVSNKQRRYSLNMEWFQDVAQELFLNALDNLNQIPCKQFDKSLIEDIREFASLSVILVSDKKIRTLNKQWRNKDYATDVLSFPFGLECPTMKSFLIEGAWEIGEIFISIDKVQEQAWQYGHSFEREICFLFVHGLLHILGFDHENKKDEKDMFARQEWILQKTGLSRV